MDFGKLSRTIYLIEKKYIGKANKEDNRNKKNESPNIRYN